jgi:hypothetical protein
MGYRERGASRSEVHLGPMTKPDHELCKFLASLPCPISFGGAWKAAADGPDIRADGLLDELNVAVATGNHAADLGLIAEGTITRQKLRRRR